MTKHTAELHRFICPNDTIIMIMLVFVTRLRKLIPMLMIMISIVIINNSNNLVKVYRYLGSVDKP